jgi:peptidoglycan/xylan/chitin deacetylase (PgdA/CDA1 family)
MPPARIALWVSSLAGIALLGRALLVGPPPLWAAVMALVAYLALAACGIALPQLEMFGDVVWRGTTGRQRLALTFDDGPHPVTTRAVLELLAQRGHKATFFVLGQKALLFPDVVREIQQAGHTLGVHGHSHPWLYALRPPGAVAEDIAHAQAAVERAAGIRPNLFRPPIGRVSPNVATGARRAGVTTVAWTVRGLDGVSMTRPEDVMRRVSKKLRDGAIVLLHDAAEDGDFEPAGVQCLPRLLDEIERRGLTTVGADEFAREA